MTRETKNLMSERGVRESDETLRINQPFTTEPQRYKRVWQVMRSQAMEFTCDSGVLDGRQIQKNASGKPCRVDDWKLSVTNQSSVN
jgi:hypothetical protein